jgi:hypothetical protein
LAVCYVGKGGVKRKRRKRIALLAVWTLVGLRATSLRKRTWSAIQSLQWLL